MKDVQTVLQAYRSAVAEERPFALATVANVTGSAYRRAGARMLIHADGRRFGSLSGGCLEADVAAHAQQTMASGQPMTIRYDAHHANGDIVLETGCKGAIDILVEPGAVTDAACSLAFLSTLWENRRTGLIATVIRSEGSCRYRLGDRLMAAEGQGLAGALVASPLSTPILTEAAQMQPEERTRALTIRLPEGLVQVLLELRRPPIALLVCGVGHDTLPLAGIAGAMGWQVTVADPNGSALTADRYPDAQTLLPIRPECVSAHFSPDLRTAAVLMTHNYALDLAWFRQLLPSPMIYLGVLGPRRRWLEIEHDLTEGGLIAPECDLTRVHSPAGLDIGSETPEEIALAIVAEIQAVMNRRTGGFLRQRVSALPESARDPLTTRSVTVQQGNACPSSAS